MGRGFLSGLISGTVFGAIILALLSLFAPLPDDAQPAVAGTTASDAASEEETPEPVAEAGAELEAEQPAAEAEAEQPTAEEPASQEATAEEVSAQETDSAQSEAPGQGQQVEENAGDEATDSQTDQPGTETPAADSDAPEQQSSTEETQDEQGAATALAAAKAEEEALALRLAELLADAPVDVTDAAPQSPDSPQSAESALRETPGLASDSAADAPDATAIDAPSSSVDTAEIDTSRPEFEVPELLEFDPEPPQVGDAVAAPRLGVEAVPEAVTAEISPGGKTLEPASEREPSPQIASEPAVPQDRIAVLDDPDAKAEAEGDQRDLVAESNALLGDGEVVSRRLPQTTDALPATAESGQDAAAGGEPVVSSVIRNRLPTLGEEVVQQETEAARAEQASAQADQIGALRAFAAPAPEPSSLPRVSVILIDAGDLGISTSEILSLRLPISVAVSTGARRAPSAYRNFRTAGLEVLALVDDLPARAGPNDVQVALEGYFQQFEEVIGILEPTDRRMQINRGLLEPVLDGLTSGGHALVTYEQGLRSAQQAAEARGVPAASVFRLLDEELEGTPKIMRYLDRAGFAANQKGHVIVLGHSYRETVNAITDWAEQNREEYHFVPVSDIMLNQ